MILIAEQFPNSMLLIILLLILVLFLSRSGRRRGFGLSRLRRLRRVREMRVICFFFHVQG